jgi:hypothetical protein
VKVYKYKSYADYKAAQVKANRSKLALTWVKPEIVAMICERILAVNRTPTFGLCHGTRRGEEQAMFSSRLGCPVLGTEIGPTASKFPNTIEWDFHRVKPEWIGACDFVYSNSLDHARTPLLALTAWVSCLKPDGVLVIEWVEKLGLGPKRSTATDPFSGTTADVCALIEKAGGSPMVVVPVVKPDLQVAVIFAGRRP